MTVPGPRVLLKARPTSQQLRDRLEAPVPDGVELYIHENDVAPHDWLETLRQCFAAQVIPPGFTWIVEGPVWALDGDLFGLCRNNETDRDLTRRLIRLAITIGAVAVNIHCVAGSPDPAVLAQTGAPAAIEQALPFLEWYVFACRAEGLLPLIENVPPICRMRRATLIYTPIGVEPADLLACVQAVPGLGITLDTSHAQLAVNAFRGVAPDPGAGASLLAAAAFYAARGGPATLSSYLEPLLPWITSVHVSNASGLLDEGMPYEQGDADLDAAVLQLAPHTRYFVTEPIDSDDDHAVLKRQMQASLKSVLGRALRDSAPSDNPEVDGSPADEPAGPVTVPLAGSPP